MSHRRTPRDTTRALHDDPAEALLLLAAGTDAVTAQEAAGQREILNATAIPTTLRGATDEDLTALGFVLGDVVDGDPLFRQAQLPDGWTREGSDHNLWSSLADEHGRRRFSIFYKVAWYDRSADITAITLASYLTECVRDDRAPVLDEAWAPRDQVLALLDEMAADKAQCAAEMGTTADGFQKQAATVAALRSKVAAAADSE